MMTKRSVADIEDPAPVDKKSKRRAALAALALFAVSIVALSALQRLLVPKYMYGVVEGAMIAEYYDEKSNHDVIFIGDCEVYSSYSPVALWDEAGVTSYVRGSPQQLVWHSYYVLKDTLKHEIPKAVVFNVQTLLHSEPESEAYNRMLLDGMPLSIDKLNCVRVSMTEDEELISYVFPILRFHSRWSELNRQDFRYFFYREPVTVNGYYMRCDVKPAGQLPTDRVLADYSYSERSMEYLDLIRELCEENGVELILVKAPSVYPKWVDERNEQIVAYAEKHGLAFYNFVELSDDIGIDMTTDTYDAGQHLNIYGAEKLSRYFARLLVSKHGIPDHASDAEQSAIWSEKTGLYDSMREQQLLEIEKYGNVISRMPEE